MREILFRGQTRRYGEKVLMGNGEKLPSRWVYGGVLQGIGDFSIIYGGENPDDPSDGLDKWVVYTDTLGQYTGLTDKDGKRIFEGDIIKSWQGKILAVKFGQYRDDEEVVSGNGWYVTGEYGTLSFDERWGGHEIIGNIHDNPELLKEG